MGKTKKRYLTRRILAMMLAVAMTVTMVPSTALAAPAGDDAAEDIVNVVAEESGDVNVPEDEGDPKDAGAIVSDDDAATDANVATTEETEGEDDAATSEDKAGDDAVTDGGDTEVNADGDTPAATPVYEIVLDGEFETKAEYNGGQPFASILDYVELKKDGEAASAEEQTKVNCTWKQNDTAITGSPKNAGSYQAVLTYEGAESLTVNCEITKAPVTISLEGLTYQNKLNVKPGTKRSEIATPVIDRISGGADELSKESGDVTLTMVIKNALTGAEIGTDELLVKGGDYVMAFTPAFKDGLAEDKKNNYELKPFTVDIEIADLIRTQITVKLTDNWKQEGEEEATQITKEYNGEAISDPKEGTAEDYTVVEVQYWDATANEYKKLDGAETVGEWVTYPGAELDENGKVKAPTAAGDYTYKVVYPGKDGVYAESSANIAVKITPMELTVEAANAAPLTVPENITVGEVLAKIEYKVLHKVGENVTDLTADVKAKHIWGTSFANSGRSQIYEPLFTLQRSTDGTAWTNMDSMDQKLSLSLVVEETETKYQYRVIFAGRKAVLNASGSYANISNINSSSDNGVDSNYYTNTTTAEGKELAVDVKAGTKAKIDVSGLLGEKKGAKTIAELNPKQYDGAPIFTAASQYKNQVKLTTEDGTEIRTEQREFTYKWFQGYGEGTWYDDRIDAEIAEKNETFDTWEWISRTGTDLKNAGVYKLTISYEDKIDPDTYYSADPVTIYFAIDPREVTITPKEESYEVLDGSSMYSFFYGEKAIEYTVTAKDGGTLPNEDIVPSGEIVKETTATPPVPKEYFDQYADWYELLFENFERNDNIKYQLVGCDIRYFGNGDYYIDSNYTCMPLEYVVTDGVASRKDVFEAIPRTITVLPMGTGELTITVDPTKWVTKEKEYDAKPFELPDGVVTVTKAGDADAELTYCVLNVSEDEDYVYPRTLNSVVDAGTYDLYVYFDGDKTYKPYGRDAEHPYGLKVGTFKITQKEIALTADLNETYTAGTTVESVLADVRNRYKVTDYVMGQEAAFAEKDDDGYLQAWEYGPYFYVVEKGSNTQLESNEVLKRDKSYEVRYDWDSSLTDYCDDIWDTVNNVHICPAIDYTIKNEPVAAFTTVPGNSSIASVSWSNYSSTISNVRIQTKNDASDSMKREVTMTEAIKWSDFYSNYGAENKKEGNFVAFRFTAPTEYGSSMPTTAMYENEIKAKGGYLVQTSGNTFTAVFNAADGDKEIRLRWEDDYVETYTLKFSEAVKLENLNNAVAAKALAFNAAPKKLAVGQEEQLDVKITKEQMGDVIYLGYESSDPETLVVTKTGKVTALKLGSATITVFPQHLVNGKPEKVPNAKTATLKINVTKLDAPKKVKATAHGTYVELNYDSPAYGYRREIYVMEKTVAPKNAAGFDSILKDMKENQWQEKGFAIAPVYITKGTEDSNRNSYGYVRRLLGLDIKKDYTIYVRNVCAVRTLTDGTGGVVTQAAMNESAAGAVVNVKTKKAEVAGLDLTFYDEKAWTYDTDGRHKIKFSELKNGVVECWVEGAFPEVLDSGKLLTDHNNITDKIWLKLPFGKEDKAKYKDVYEEPKLEYALYGCYDKKTGTWGWGTKNDYASIDKKGKIKITGFPDGGNLYVRVRDTVTGAEDVAGLPLIIEEADSVAAAKKSVTLSVGQEVSLRSLLTYNLGKVKLTAYPNRLIDLEKVHKAIKDQNQEKNFAVNEYGNLRAINGGGTLTLDLTDKNVEKISGTDKATVKVTIKSKDLEQVKNLKACDVIHNNFGLTFKYTGGANSFLLEISDAKKPIYSKVIGWSDINTLYATDKQGRYIQVRDAEGNLMYDDGDPVWTVVKDTYEIPNIGAYIKLYKESQYTVSLTPIYAANKAKPTTAKVKTTKIPAQDWYLGNEYYYGEWIWGCDKRGGMGITVSEGDRNMNLSEYRTTLNAVSGNAYTLTADVQYNRGRVNDTLVWTVGDAKVASVKAAAGTYCITLKGLKPGDTILEVKSKIMGNKVIARYNIHVDAVQNAYNNLAYYGDNEPGYGEPDVPVAGELLTESVSAASGSVRCAFTAPYAGTYYFWSTGTYDTIGTLYNSSNVQLKSNDDDASGGLNIGTIDNNFSFSQYLTANQTVYIEVKEYDSDSFACTLHVSMQNPAK
ncbi:MAG: Ig-like domain-containing protein [Lachnospiraceae bacterium]|nr:Ig-like domain-containing protein [Lachnospiraceae bacterium]